MSHIIAMGGGGFMMEPDNLALDRYVIAQTSKARPKVAFLPQAGGENEESIISFYKAFTQLDCHPTHLSLFYPHTADLATYLLAQDIIYVGGGNTKSMLALWREWNLPAILRRAYDQGIVLAGVSAGSICWFEQGLTDSIPGNLTALPCLGFLPGSCTPHYDGEALRRPSLHALLSKGGMMSGYAFDDGAAGHFVDGTFKTTVTSRPNAKGYYVQSDGSKVTETILETRYLG